MNLYFLVEGERTEKKLYRAWLSHVFPALRQVHDLADMSSDCFYLFGGGGNPGCFQRIGDSLADISATPHIDHFFVCVDAEESAFSETLARFEKEVSAQLQATGARRANPTLGTHVIVQDCCVETWLLGHSRMLKRNPESGALRDFKRFYDVSVDDPESMTAMAPFATRAQFHHAYLREMLREQGLSYSKASPGVSLERSYLDALAERCRDTGHLGSLRRLLRLWDELGRG